MFQTRTSTEVHALLVLFILNKPMSNLPHISRFSRVGFRNLPFYSYGFHVRLMGITKCTSEKYLCLLVINQSH